MVLGQVAEGVGLAAWSVGFYVFARWQGSNDSRMRRLAQARWWLDRRTVRALRRGKMSQEEWFGRLARNYRATVKWAFTPVVALSLTLSVALLVHGVISTN